MSQLTTTDVITILGFLTAFAKLIQVIVQMRQKDKNAGRKIYKNRTIQIRRTTRLFGFNLKQCAQSFDFKLTLFKVECRWRVKATADC